MRLSHKIFAFTFVIAAATLASVAVHTVEETTQLLVDQSIDAADRHAEREAVIMIEQVEAARSDVLLLASIDAARRMPTATGVLPASYRAELEHVFETVMSEKPIYTQVRLIGLAEGGKELVRVNQDATGIHAVPESKLQSKQDRYYFRQTVELGDNQTFVSKLDLNQEHGAIVEPHQPVFRISSPVFGPDDELVGIVVINIDMDVLLKDIIALGPGGFPVLTDCAGEILYHPNPDRRFAFEFGRHDKIQEEYGIQQAWSNWIKDPGNSGVTSFATPTHIVSVARIDFPGAWDDPDGVRTLVIGNVLPQTLIRQSSEELRDHLYVTLFAVCAFLGIAIGGVTGYLTRPVSALTRAADRIAAGESGVEVSVTSKDEIGILARALRRMLRALDEAARTKELAAMGRMAAMVAHDLRNALSSIKVNIHTLELGCRHPAKQREQQWGLANEQIGYMEAVLTDMLTFAKPEQPKFDWHDLNSIVGAAAIAVAPKAAEKGIDLAPPDLPPLPAVWGDRTQLIRLFRNLMENAVQAAPVGGHVRMGARVAASDGGNEVLVEVIDDGEGIARENRDHLFDPFFTTRTTGTGLGLAIVRRIVDQHGGRVDFHSELGKGTTFLVALQTGPRQDLTMGDADLAVQAAD